MVNFFNCESLWEDAKCAQRVGLEFPSKLITELAALCYKTFVL